MGVYGRFMAGLASLLLVCEWFSQFVGGLLLVWVVCGWFRVLQLTLLKYNNPVKKACFPSNFEENFIYKETSGTVKKVKLVTEI